MNPYAPPSQNGSPASVSVVAIGILTISIFSLGLISSLLCGISFYLDIQGANNDDLMATVLTFGCPLIGMACIGISAGMIHLRRNSNLPRIPLAAYIVAAGALIVLSIWEPPIVRWLSISLVCHAMAVAISIRTALGCQRLYNKF
ncbi:hypothetical protein [Roseiconus lacunae]|uniref:Uncharacterized protein n=1 Tax=Roseiconus lacunae TaxID=2605694 RepID=A0ABT7PSR6_9BACT|nr:hypothetical protein [Roseiconus lacunae]MDM4019403.1 hypothetical protein [Roseiconus lacunae]